MYSSHSNCLPTHWTCSNRQLTQILFIFLRKTKVERLRQCSKPVASPLQCAVISFFKISSTRRPSCGEPSTRLNISAVRPRRNMSLRSCDHISWMRGGALVSPLWTFSFDDLGVCIFRRGSLQRQHLRDQIPTWNTQHYTFSLYGSSVATSGAMYRRLLVWPVSF